MFWLKPNLQYISFIGLKPDAIDVSRQLANWTNLDFFLFNDFTDLLYHDYVRILFYAKAILEKNSLKQKQLIYKDLKPFVQKSGYVKIYDVLEGLDPLFSEYFSE